MVVGYQNRQLSEDQQFQEKNDKYISHSLVDTYTYLFTRNSMN